METVILSVSKSKVLDIDNLESELWCAMVQTSEYKSKKMGIPLFFRNEKVFNAYLKDLKGLVGEPANLLNVRLAELIHKYKDCIVNRAKF